MVILSQQIKTVERNRGPRQASEQVPKGEFHKGDPAHAARHEDTISNAEWDKTAQQ